MNKSVLKSLGIRGNSHQNLKENKFYEKQTLD
jgi:hypothetical protein